MDGHADGSAVVPVRAADEAALVAMMARAFSQDPVFSWAFPEANRRVADLALVFGSAFADLTRHGCSWRIADGGGVCLWAPPGETWDEVAMAPWMERMAATYRADDLARVGAFFAMVGEHHPAEPHYYLGVLAADLDRQGQGLGSALLRAGLAIVDEAGAPAYLESSNVKNVPLYERFGFQVTRELAPAPDAPPVYFMWRPSRS